MPSIRTESLSKQYGEKTALDELDMRVEGGEVFGFLGPNGAGKSTTIDILLDFVRPTDGRAVVAGEDPQQDPLAVRREIGILPDDYSLYDRLSGREHVELAIEMNDSDDDPETVLSRVGLADAIDQPASAYSKGMRQRLALGMALVGDPSVLILDEPSSGIDPNGVEEIRSIIREEAARGTTVFFSSHLLDQVEAVADRVAIVAGGELVAVDTVDGLRDRFGSRATITLSVRSVPDDHGLSGLDAVSSVESGDGTITVDCADPGAKSAVIARVEAAGASITDIEIEETSLADLFGELTDGGDDE